MKRVILFKGDVKIPIPIQGNYVFIRGLKYK